MNAKDHATLARAIRAPRLGSTASRTTEKPAKKPNPVHRKKAKP
jgi:hypothetical protein